LVAEIFDEQGKTYFSFKPRRVRRVMTQDVALKLTRALVQVTEDGGTGTAAAVSGFKVAGKTGTSMKAKPGSGYGGAGYFSSFGGFFPVDDPQIAMFILINDPDFEYRWGGKCAAPVFSEIIHNTLLSDCDVIDRTRLGLPGTGIQTAASTPPEAAASLPPAKNLLAESGATSSIAGDGSPNKAHDSKHAVMPDIRGLTVRKAVARLSSLGLKAQLVEGGIKVKEQYPGPGAILPRGALCSLTGLPAATRGRHPGHRLTADNSFSLAQRTSHTVKRTPFLQQTEKEEQ
ncbi:MAG: penicillin-binding transpeptidase domain-containing protein, partial [Gemmatimonadota bacterium]|nr:penicillin-binding transpeptidase domain-containing protein [Gemmatimonadota bacterium]